MYSKNTWEHILAYRILTYTFHIFPYSHIYAALSHIFENMGICEIHIWWYDMWECILTRECILTYRVLTYECDIFPYCHILGATFHMLPYSNIANRGNRKHIYTGFISNLHTGLTLQHTATHCNTLHHTQHTYTGFKCNLHTGIIYIMQRLYLICTYIYICIYIYIYICTNTHTNRGRLWVQSRVRVHSDLKSAFNTRQRLIEQAL